MGGAVALPPLAGQLVRETPPHLPSGTLELARTSCCGPGDNDGGALATREPARCDSIVAVSNVGCAVLLCGKASEAAGEAPRALETPALACRCSVPHRKARGCKGEWAP